ncbi:sensor domain-containing protein [Mycobacteroides chelonae]|uniref:sensor domain-containing protein n=1 Tax=Mycobacteroides chelonae TaxID=1774 RepID=UPI0009C1A7E4|nr:sensor domain-containing protein [Mycobacteroides chelonae]
MSGKCLRAVAIVFVAGVLVAGCSVPGTPVAGQGRQVSALEALPDTAELSSVLRAPMKVFVNGYYSGQQWVELARNSEPKSSECEPVASLSDRVADISGADSVAMERWYTDDSADPMDDQKPWARNKYVVLVYVVAFQSEDAAKEWFVRSVDLWKGCPGQSITRSIGTNVQYSDKILDVQKPSGDAVSAILLRKGQGDVVPADEWATPRQVGRALSLTSRFVIDTSVENMNTVRGARQASGTEALAVAQLVEANASE